MNKIIGIEHNQTPSEVTDELIKELEKCILVCSNCHRELENPDKTNLI